MNPFLQSFVVAVKGIRTAIVEQRNLKIHVAVSLLVVVAGIYFEITTTEWDLVAFAIGLVLSAELLNTAIEALTDLLHPDQHPLAGKVKDIAAGGVLAASLCALVIGLLVFLKYLPL